MFSPQSHQGTVSLDTPTITPVGEWTVFLTPFLISTESPTVLNTQLLLFSFFLFFFFFVLHFLGPLQRHMEVPRLEV